ncbi:CbtA family protein [uncultured Alsobacter sp.]|uniref:CbtA family protein n=1 Tax=uncultured Alsobacter sp. TaxID=1748258 RepID=UPI0025E3677A|nr:CbtA family protein [uncultured Alsobacter sp.]
MVGTLLLRGMLCGALAGVVATNFAWIFGEPTIDWAIAFEEHAAKMAGEAQGAEVVSRAVQSTLGLFTGVTVIGAAMGGLFGIAYAFALGRFGRIGPAGTAVLLALAGFLVLAFVPQLKYPANPPAIGHADTIGARTGLYFSLLGLSLFAAGLATAFGRAVAARHGGRIGTVAGLVFYAVAVAVVMMAMPTVNEVPDEFSSVVLMKFRLASLGTSAVLWLTLGAAFAWLSGWRPGGSRRVLA